MWYKGQYSAAFMLRDGNSEWGETEESLGTAATTALLYLP
jgi:hypothetical protein